MPERRKYDSEFREGAVTIVRETGRPIAEVARDLGVGAGTLGNWVRKDRLARGEEPGGTRVDAGYVRRLERHFETLVAIDQLMTSKAFATHVRRGAARLRRAGRCLIARCSVFRVRASERAVCVLVTVQQRDASNKLPARWR
jgi:transposase